MGISGMGWLYSRRRVEGRRVVIMAMRDKRFRGARMFEVAVEQRDRGNMETKLMQKKGEMSNLRGK
jgi:hypothetical protein